jgi:hypothetical protein
MILAVNESLYLPLTIDEYGALVERKLIGNGN